MLQNAYLLAKIGADTAENERKFAGSYKNLAEIIPIQDIKDMFRQFATELDQTYLRDNCRYMFFIQGLERFSSSKGQEGTLQTPVWCLAHIPDKEEW